METEGSHLCSLTGLPWGSCHHCLQAGGATRAPASSTETGGTRGLWSCSSPTPGVTGHLAPHQDPVPAGTGCQAHVLPSPGHLPTLPYSSSHPPQPHVSPPVATNQQKTSPGRPPDTQFLSQVKQGWAGAQAAHLLAQEMESIVGTRSPGLPRTISGAGWICPSRSHSPSLFPEGGSRPSHSHWLGGKAPPKSARVGEPPGSPPLLSLGECPQPVRARTALGAGLLPREGEG